MIDALNLELQKEQVQSSIEALKEKTLNVQPQITLLNDQLRVQESQLKTLEREKGRITNLLKAGVGTTKQLDDLNSQIDALKLQMKVGRQQISVQKTNTGILLLSVFVLKVPINGSLFLLVSESMLFTITSLSLGLLISSVTESQQTAMFISLTGMLLPTVMLSGFMFPIENMPLPLQLMSNIIPAKWYYIIVKSVMIKGLGFAFIWKETLILAGMTVFLLGMSVKKFKIRLA